MCKKLPILAALLLTTPAWAQHGGNGRGNQNGHGNNSNQYGNQAATAPELNPGGLGVTVTSLAGGLLILTDKARERSAGLAG